MSLSPADALCARPVAPGVGSAGRRAPGWLARGRLTLSLLPTLPPTLALLPLSPACLPCLPPAEELAPGALAAHPRVYFKLQCQKFAELVRGA